MLRTLPLERPIVPAKTVARGTATATTMVFGRNSEQRKSRSGKSAMRCCDSQPNRRPHDASEMSQRSVHRSTASNHQ
eukprot:4639735-Prymnesium_polylepis.1